jgi:hypothetical protein
MLTLCACIHRDARRCLEYRYDLDHDDNESGEVCECPCHGFDEEEMEVDKP